jgi:hypothetical protein
VDLLGSFSLFAVRDDRQSPGNWTRNSVSGVDKYSSILEMTCCVGWEIIPDISKVAFFLHLQGQVDCFNLKVKAYKSVFFLKEKVNIIKFLHSVNKNDFI